MINFCFPLKIQLKIFQNNVLPFICGSVIIICTYVIAYLSDACLNLMLSTNIILCEVGNLVKIMKHYNILFLC